MRTSIWASVEFFCVAADLKHDQYLHIVKENGYTHQALGEKAYDLVRQTFNEQLEEDQPKMPGDVVDPPEKRPQYTVNQWLDDGRIQQRDIDLWGAQAVKTE